MSDQQPPSGSNTFPNVLGLFTRGTNAIRNLAGQGSDSQADEPREMTNIDSNRLLDEDEDMDMRANGEGSVDDEMDTRADGGDGDMRPVRVSQSVPSLRERSSALPRSRVNPYERMPRSRTTSRNPLDSSSAPAHSLIPPLISALEPPNPRPGLSSESPAFPLVEQAIPSVHPPVPSPVPALESLNPQPGPSPAVPVVEQAIPPVHPPVPSPVPALESPNPQPGPSSVSAIGSSAEPSTSISRSESLTIRIPGRGRGRRVASSSGQANPPNAQSVTSHPLNLPESVTITGGSQAGPSRPSGNNNDTVSAVVQGISQEPTHMDVDQPSETSGGSGDISTAVQTIPQVSTDMDVDQPADGDRQVRRGAGSSGNDHPDSTNPLHTVIAGLRSSIIPTVDGGDERFVRVPQQTAAVVCLSLDEYHKLLARQSGVSSTRDNHGRSEVAVQNADGYAAEDEEGGLIEEKRPRKHKTKVEKLIDEMLRRFLKQIKLLPSHHVNLPPPESVADEAVIISYLENNCPQQDANDPRLAWHKPFSYSWNRGMLSCVARRFLREVEDEERPLLPSSRCMPLQDLENLKDALSKLKRIQVISLIENKLKRAQAIYRLQQRSSTELEFRAKLASRSESNTIKDRRAARRSTLFSRRQDIVKKHRDGGDIWRTVEVVLSRLSADGMSDDETETETPKKVRRVRLAFLNRAFSDLFASLDTYPHEGVALKKDKRGNRHIERIPISISTNKERFVSRLPRNWYDDDWWRSLKQWEQDELDARAAVPIPVLGRYEHV